MVRQLQTPRPDTAGDAFLIRYTFAQQEQHRTATNQTTTAKPWNDNHHRHARFTTNIAGGETSSVAKSNLPLWRPYFVHLGRIVDGRVAAQALRFFPAVGLHHRLKVRVVNSRLLPKQFNTRVQNAQQVHSLYKCRHITCPVTTERMFGGEDKVAYGPCSVAGTTGTMMYD